MKESRSNNVFMAVVGLVVVFVILFCVFALDGRRTMQQQQTAYSNVRMTSEQFWQSFPG